MAPPLRFPPPTGDPAKDRIIGLRRCLGLSQAALGRLVGVTGPAVSRWERGLSSPSDVALALLGQLERTHSRPSLMAGKCAGCRAGCGQ
jgi:DNA-binding transcriptional regulator YiaG